MSIGCERSRDVCGCGEGWVRVLVGVVTYYRERVNREIELCGY